MTLAGVINQPIERLVGFAQVVMSVVYTVGYFWVLNKLLNGEIETPPEWKDILASLVSLLTAGVLMILQFWFSRSRAKTEE